MKLSSLYELAVFAAVLQLLLPGTEIANAQESGPKRGVQAEPVSSGHEPTGERWAGGLSTR